MKAVVTGATGFIGRALCRSLLDAGIETIALNRRDAARLDGVTSVVADLADEPAVTRCLSDVKPDLVFHLAGLTSATRVLDAVVPVFTANLTSTVNLLTAATRVGCRRIVLAGSLEEPDAASPDAVPSSPYAASKWAGSMYARMFWQLYQTPVTVARIFMVYGPQQRDSNKLIPYAIRCLLAGEPPRLSSGTRAVDWVFVEDVARGLLALGRADGVDGLSVDLGTGVLTSVREVVERLARLAGCDTALQFGAMPDRSHEQVRRADVARAEQLTGWRAVVDLDDGLARTVDSYRVLAKS